MATSLDPRPGLTKSHPVALLVTVATPVTVFTRSATGMARTVKVKKIFVSNGSPSFATVDVGTGLAGAFVASFPRIRVEAGMHETISGDQLPNLELAANVTASAIVAAGIGAGDLAVRVQLEVEEIGG